MQTACKQLRENDAVLDLPSVLTVHSDKIKFAQFKISRLKSQYFKFLTDKLMFLLSQQLIRSCTIFLVILP